MKKKVLFICGSLNQTTMMHKISLHFKDYDCYFTPYYADGFLDWLAKNGILDFTILGGNFKKQTEEYLRKNELKVDYKGLSNNYDLVYTCADLIMPKNIRNKKVILVQEGMTDPENFLFYLVKYFNFPRWAASTAAMGMSNMYDIFCVASEGYKRLFIKKGAKPEKIIVTGIPNFDNAKQYLNNDFPYKNFVLVATSDMRETFKYENRKKFIKECVRIANGRQLIFKLHPNEKYDRAIREINKYAPGAIVFQNGNTNHMIANCDVLITKYSSVVYIGLALGKEVYSSFDINVLKQLMPIQNNGTSAERIARIGIHLLESSNYSLEEIHEQYELKAI
ncbi:hypothetical protein [Rosettibacter firmus]|uniref:hypothetical protein n=1 Tax=Rosettibacter firmus TaxID=3111522 RepID=UPI00336BC88F